MFAFRFGLEPVGGHLLRFGSGSSRTRDSFHRIYGPLENCIDALNHPTYVPVEIAPSIHASSIDERKTLETFGKLLRPGHVCLSDEQRNSWNALAKCGLHLNSNRIGVVVNSAASAFSASQPSRPDDNEDRISLCQRLLYVGSEIFAKRYVIYIDENGILAKAAGDSITNAPGKYIGVRAPV